jgi:hypothetical protein
LSNDTSPATARAEESSTLWRTILDPHGGQILEYASDQFLDLAVSRRLKSINARDLINLLANAERLGYIDTDIVDHDETVHTVYETLTVVPHHRLLTSQYHPAIAERLNSGQANRHFSNLNCNLAS